MKPINLIIQNFFCHEKSIIDFTKFNSALVVGKIDGNDSYSNGVGKTTIFKAIEYVLFNASDVNLEKIIRDDTSSCKIIFDFESNDKTYRVSRSRTKKGSTDLSLYQRTSNEGSYEEVHAEIADEKFWKDISGRRAPDTEKDLINLIKINPKSFRSTVHFAQNDFSGLTSATPEKRKLLLKEALSLAVYSKLEKLAKDQSSKISKEIDKQQILLQSLGNPEDELKLLTEKIIEINSQIEQNNIYLAPVEKEIKDLKSKVDLEKNKLQDLTNQNKYLINQKSKIVEDSKKIESLIADLSKKKNLLLEEAKILANELREMKDLKDILEAEDYSKISNFESLILTKEEIKKNLQVNQKSLHNKILELNLPLPEGGNCKNCRQVLTLDHIENCKKEIKKEITLINSEIVNINEQINQVSIEIQDLNKSFKSITAKEKQLDSVKKSYLLKEKEIKDKKEIYAEYNSMLNSHKDNLASLKKELVDVEEQIKCSSVNEMNSLNELISQLSSLIETKEILKNKILQTISSLDKEMAVTSHLVSQKEKDKASKKEIYSLILKLESSHSMYPKVIDAFSSHGIPNLIIQNLLDDLQDEANKLLENLKPGLQLQFIVEKENKDDTLDILYFVQGKPREYEQLSGAMKLSVNFSLKLGLSFLLQNMFDTRISFLLLDEIDQALDKAGVDAFADIVKHFQKDFTIMVITHNERLKDKFKHAILVEQNRNMISTASVVSSW